MFQLDFKTNRPLRYIQSAYSTLITFLNERPDTIFVQNPSLVLAALAVNYGRIARVPVVVDAHNAGVFPFDGKKWWANRLADYLFRHAALTIVTNRALSEHIKQRGGKTAILPDPLPEFGRIDATKPLIGRVHVLFICSFASDEPYMEVIEAGRLLSKDIIIYITGRYKGDVNGLKKSMPENVILTGFLPEHDFIQLLHSVDIVIDLTTREDCLLCGAYEAVSAEKVLIVSATRALKEYFHKGTLYTQNDREDLVRQIERAISNKVSLATDIKELKKEKTTEWALKKAEFEADLEKF
ncbi:MAG: glycosyltransferase [Deltaproteobacteria bacterium]|nr:glycosyltransferase [Deltaproteobacteria bacterium]